MEKDDDIRQAMETICRELAAPLPDNTGDFKTHLSFMINEMIDKDFNRLVLLLYRLDIDEAKLRRLLLQDREANAGDKITEMILARQLEKQKSRISYRPDDKIDEDEKW